ncbi:glycosyltransferase [Acetobacter indonesiensis]|uniref:glycosyltransferase n=1 Tax=Acetobacter indonesiensis TaxID=104101 RepID=UPI0039E9F646
MPQRTPSPTDNIEEKNQRLRKALADAYAALSAAKETIDQLKGENNFLLDRIQQNNQIFSDLNQTVEQYRHGFDDSLRPFLPHPSRLRRVWRALRYPPLAPAFPPLPVAPALPTPAKLAYSPNPLPTRYSGPRRFLFVAGELGTTGQIYRCQRMSKAFAVCGIETRVLECPVVGPDDVDWADVLVIWRARISDHVATMLRLFREQNKPIIFDIDDLVFKPDLAKIEIIDGIRHSATVTEETTRQIFTDIHKTAEQCDMAFTTTVELVDQLLRIGLKPALVLPNTFDTETLKRGRLAARRRTLTGPDSTIRIGYAAGSRTHQRDFKLVSHVLADLLKQDDRVRLVLFTLNNTLPLLLVEEFPELAGLEDKIEWRTFVPLEDLPAEMARFDISIVPLEAGNIFCEAKSEIKFFEAALGNVCSIASPTGPFKRIIRHGENGMLAATEQDWRDHLTLLIESPELRKKLAQNAFHEALWFFGPQRLSLLTRDVALSMGTGLDAAQASARLLKASTATMPVAPLVPDSTILFLHDALGQADVSVVITSYNYGHFILEALESVAAQTIETLDLIIVDDGSEDDSLLVITEWCDRHTRRFNRIVLLQSATNQGLGGARNIGMAATETPYAMQLDADNRLCPQACERLFTAIHAQQAAFSYPIIEQFGADGHNDVLGANTFSPLALVPGNYIDAMAMVAKWAWAAVGGYYVQRDAMGWEDFDLWCTFSEHGFIGIHVPEVLAEYRRHDSSMTNGVTETTDHKPRVVALLEKRHPWLRLTTPDAAPR